MGKKNKIVYTALIIIAVIFGFLYFGYQNKLYYDSEYVPRSTDRDLKAKITITEKDHLPLELLLASIKDYNPSLDKQKNGSGGLTIDGETEKLSANLNELAGLFLDISDDVLGMELDINDVSITIHEYYINFSIQEAAFIYSTYYGNDGVITKTMELNQWDLFRNHQVYILYHNNNKGIVVEKRIPDHITQVELNEFMRDRQKGRIHDDTIAKDTDKLREYLASKDIFFFRYVSKWSLVVFCWISAIVFTVVAFRVARKMKRTQAWDGLFALEAILLGIVGVAGYAGTIGKMDMVFGIIFLSILPLYYFFVKLPEDKKKNGVDSQ